MGSGDSFFESKKFKTIMKYVYGYGGALVIVVAMFKIQHWPGAGIMLIAGLGVEAVIFMDEMFNESAAFNQDLSGWCVQSNFASEPNRFNHDANDDWRNNAAKQPDWDGADGSAANCN